MPQLSPMWWAFFPFIAVVVGLLWMSGFQFCGLWDLNGAEGGGKMVLIKEW